MGFSSPADESLRLCTDSLVGSEDVLDFVPGSSPVTTREIYLETDQIGSPERKVLAEKEDSRWGRKRTGKRLSNKKMNKARSVEEQAYAPWNIHSGG